MKTKLTRLLSMVLCLVMLIGVFPFSAMAASYTVYLEDEKISDGDEYYIDLDDGVVYEDDEDGDEVAEITVSPSKGIKLSSISDLFSISSSSYELVVEFYTSSKSSSIVDDTYIDPDDYDEIYCIVYVVDDDDYEDYEDWYDYGYYDYFYEYEDEEECSKAIYELTFYWDEDDDEDYTMDVDFEEENYLDPDDFYGSSKWTSVMDILFDEPKYGGIYDDDGDEITYNYDSGKTLYYMDEVEDLYYYCDSSTAESKGYDYMDFMIYKNSTLMVEGTMYFYFDDDSSSSSGITVTFAVESGDENYLSVDLFDDSDDIDLSDYSTSKVYFRVESLPTSGSLYDDDDDKLSKGDEIKLSSIDDIYYYRSASSTSTYSMTFSLIYYKTSSSSGTYLVKKGTLYFAFSTDTAASFTKEFVAGTGVSFTATDFKNNFTATSSTSSLAYVKIVTLPSSGTLYLGTKEVSKGDEISVAKLSTLAYVPDSASVTSDSFTYAATSGSVYSSTATITLDGAYAPDGYTVSTSGSIVSVTFDTATASGTQVTQTLDADDITYLVTQAGTSGSTLVIYMPLSSSSTYSGRTLSIDSSLFTSTNISIYSRVILVDTTSSGYNLYLTVPTASVYSLYSASSYSGSFTMGLSAASLTDEDKSAAATSVGMARDVDMQIGVINVSPEGAELSIPYNTSNDENTAVIMVRTGYQSYEPVLSSTWSDSMPYLSTDTNPYVTCNVEANKIYISTVNSQSFSDLASTHWGYDYVRFLSARGVMSGYDGTYAGMVMPDNSVSRAEFIKMLVVALDLYDETATTTYTDVTDNASWAAAYIGSAQNAGILTDSGDSFNPTEAITREDMALYAYRAAQAAGITLPTTTEAVTFSDEAEFSSTEIATAISAMQQAGIISGEAVNGEATGYFDPSGVTTRAAAAKIISMLMELAY